MESKVVGMAFIYTFFASTQIDRIHHRLVEEGRYLGETLGEAFIHKHLSFFKLVYKIDVWMSNNEVNDQNFIILPKASQRSNGDLDIDTRELHYLTYAVACDEKVKSSIAVALMMSLIVSSLDNGETVFYLENISTQVQFQRRIMEILKELMVGRHEDERDEVEAKLHEDIRTTDHYDSRIYYDAVATLKTKMRLIRRHKSKLGSHNVRSLEDYRKLTLEVDDSLFNDAFCEVDYACPIGPLHLLLSYIDDYYSEKNDALLSSIDFSSVVSSTRHLLPVHNDDETGGNFFFDRVFFYPE